MRTFDATELTQVLQSLLLEPIADTVVVKKINTDTRTIQAGDTFVALGGEHFDGHDYAHIAVERGASHLLVERVLPLGVPQIVVTDTRLALGALATQIRRDFTKRGGKVVGLTGSVGKTTNKQMLAAILSQVGETHATKGNLNNDLGVPFTWFDLPADSQFAVIEMGANHQSEIAYLATITRPQVAMITNAGEAHLQGFGGLDGVAKGKGELFAQLTDGQTAVINADDHYADYWRGLLATGVKTMCFAYADNHADVYATAVSKDGSQFTLCYQDDRVAVQLPTVGQHNVSNALGCAACAVALGASLADIAKGLAMFETAQGRLQKHVIGDYVVIDDTYNANPMSMRASADILSVAAGHRIMVLGDMGELGEDELALHQALGKDLHDRADCFLCLGTRMTAFAEVNPKAQHFASMEALCESLLQQLQSLQQATVLVKGSRSMTMERVVEYVLTAPSLNG